MNLNDLNGFTEDWKKGHYKSIKGTGLQIRWHSKEGDLSLEGLLFFMRRWGEEGMQGTVSSSSHMQKIRSKVINEVFVVGGYHGDVHYIR